MPETRDSTSISLLRGLKARDPVTWDRMAGIYGPVVYRWCRHNGVPAHEVADVIQEVFQAVATSIDGFQRPRVGDSFRGWMWGITRNKVNDFFRRAGRQPGAYGGTDAQLQMGRVPYETDPSEDSVTAHDDMSIVLHRALELIRPEFTERNWQVFWRSTIDQESSIDIGRDLDMTANAVRQAKYRVLRRLRCELQEIE